MTPDIQTLKTEHLSRQNSASNPIHSVWVSANAGAGKTHILVERIIRLLLPPFNCPPHKILCLTYTKAAATEMTERLFHRLGAWITKTDAELLDDITKMTGRTPAYNDIIIARRLFASVLETAGGLKIQTIHGFCEHLLRRFPNESGYPTDFTLLSDVDLKNIYHDALNNLSLYVLQNPQTELANALGVISKHYNMNDFIDLVINSRKIYTQITADGSEFWNAERLVQTLGLPSEIENKNIYDDFLNLLDDTKISCLISALESGGTNDNKRADTLKYIQIKGIDNFNLWSELFLTGKKEMRVKKSFITKDIQKKFPDLSDYLFTLYDVFAKTYIHHNGMLIYDLTKNTSLVLKNIYTFIDNVKHAKNVCDFDDIIMRTRNLLTNTDVSSWVLWKFDGGIDHILVDEAQDTAPEQWDIIRSITQDFFKPNHNDNGFKHRTVFAVGDEKQSIYGFQGAAPEKMAQNADFFASQASSINHQWSAENLRGSFRSSPAIMNLVDNVFQNEAAAGVLFGNLERIEHYAVANMGPGYVEMMPPVVPVQNDNADAWTDALDSVSSLSPKAINAKKIALKIQELLQSPKLIPSTRRPAEPKDIMILLQKRDATMQSLIKELIALKIPVSGLDRIYLLNEMAILDMLALIDFCLYTDDDLSLAQILRSPLCDISEEDLFILCHNRTGKLWHSLDLHKDNKPNFSDAYHFLNILLMQSQTLSVFEFISFVLETHQGRKKFIARLGRDCLDGLDELVNKALAFGQNRNPSLQAFVQFMRDSGGNQKRDIDTNHNAVQIMTIHGSKGLEAPIVFLPDCCDLPKTNGDLFKRFVITADNTPMILKEGGQHPTAIDHKEFLKSKDLDENRRLLYVALTRAKDWLFISGKLRKSKNDKYKISDKCWYHYIKNGLLCLDNYDMIDSENSQFPTYIYNDIATHEITYKPKPAVTESSPPALHTRSLPAWALADAVTIQHQKNKFIAPSTATNTHYVHDDDNAKMRGIIIHKLLEILVNMPPQHRPQATDNYLKKYNLTAQTHERYKSEIFNLMDNPDFNILLSSNGLSEVPIMGQIPELDNMNVSGQIDRMVITDTQILLADYKTDKDLSKDTPLPEQYVLQMALYQSACKHIYPNKTIKCFIIATAKPDIIEIDTMMLNTSLKEYTHKNPIKFIKT
jgi:ATP-dependent helicase/nuclease subunit A